MLNLVRRITPIFLSVLILLSSLMFILFALKDNSIVSEQGVLVEDSLPLGKYEKPFKLTVGQMVSATKYVDGESASHNVMYDIVKEVTNIDLQSVFSATIGTAYDYQLNTYILEGNVPDLFFCSINQLSDLIDQGMVADLTEAYEKYASPGLRLALEYNYTGDLNVWNNGDPSIPKNTAVLDACTYDGKLYGIPFLSDLFVSCPLIWIRADWLKTYLTRNDIPFTENNLSSFLPKNFQEYLDLVDFFSHNDPDNNGIADDTFGCSIGYNVKNLQGIANVYGAYPGYYMKDDNGEFYYGSDTDEFLDVIQLFNGLYNDGSIDKNSAVDGQALKTALASGKIGSFVGEFWSIMSYSLNDAYFVNQNVDWLPWAIRDFDGEVIEPLVPYNITDNGFYCMGYQTLNPEAVIILANHIISSYFGNGEEFTQKFVETYSSEKYSSVADQLMMYLPVRLDAPNKNIRYAFDCQKAIEENDPSFLTLDETLYYNNIKAFLADPNGKGKVYYPYYKIFAKGGAYDELCKYTDYNYEIDKNHLEVKFKRPAFSGLNTPEMAQYNSIVNDYEYQELVWFYCQPVPLTVDDWANFRNQLKVKGVTKILEGLNGK